MEQNIDRFSNAFTQSLRNLPRYDFSFHKLSNTWEPESKNYYESLGVVAIPFAVLVFLGFLYSVFILFLSCCRRSPKEYSIRRIRVVQLGLIVGSLFIFVGCIMGLSGSLMANATSHNVVSEVESVLESTASKFGEITSALKWLNQTQQVGNSTFTFLNSLSETNDDFIHYDSQVHGSTNQSVIGIAIVFGFGILVSLLGCCAVVPRISGKGIAIILMLAILAMNLGSFSWGVMIGGTSGGVFVNDMCFDGIDYLEASIPGSYNTNTTQLQTAVHYYFTCQGPSPWADLQNYTVEANATAYHNLSEAIAQNRSQAEIQHIRDIIREIAVVSTNLDIVNDCHFIYDGFLATKKNICYYFLDEWMIMTLGAMFTTFGLFFLWCTILHTWERHVRSADGYMAIEDDRHIEFI